MWPSRIMYMWICRMGMWMLHNGYVGDTQEDLSIVPSSKGDQKRQKRAHEKPTIITLLEVVVLGQVEKAFKKHLPTLDAKAKLKIGSRNSNENHG